ncbi:hypothetical protein [Burkholderia sp. MSMB1078WGS]|nr:hypothetical protein [Burkholderia sp. MSMB1078WGS]
MLEALREISEDTSQPGATRLRAMKDLQRVIAFGPGGAAEIDKRKAH